MSVVRYIYVIKFQLESLLSTYHIFGYFDFHSLFPAKKKKYGSNRSFSCKASRLAFSFLPSVRFEIFAAGFSRGIFIFPLVHWLKKSDYSSLVDIVKFLKTAFFIANLRWLLLAVLPQYSRLSWSSLFFDFAPSCATEFDYKLTQHVAQIILYHHVTKQFLPVQIDLSRAFDFRICFGKTLVAFDFYEKRT